MLVGAICAFVVGLSGGRQAPSELVRYKFKAGQSWTYLLSREYDFEADEDHPPLPIHQQVQVQISLKVKRVEADGSGVLLCDFKRLSYTSNLEGSSDHGPKDEESTAVKITPQGDLTYLQPEPVSDDYDATDVMLFDGFPSERLHAGSHWDVRVDAGTSHQSMGGLDTVGGSVVGSFHSELDYKGHGKGVLALIGVDDADEAAASKNTITMDGKFNVTDGYLESVTVTIDKEATHAGPDKPVHAKILRVTKVSLTSKS